MRRTAGSGASTRKAIFGVAINKFFTKGYEATSLREIAAEVDIQVGSLYNHIAGKSELLHEIMSDIMDELLQEMGREIDRDFPTASERFEAAFRCHISFHAAHAREVFIGNTELRSLLPEQLRVISQKRHAYQNMLQMCLVDAVKENDATLLSPNLQTYALVAMGSHVASWYRPDGPLSLETIIDVYTKLAKMQLTYSPGI